jgi:hypothetical protein
MNQEHSDKQEEKKSPFLKALLSGKTRALTLNRVRVVPVVNAYRQMNLSKTIQKNQQPPANELPEKEWFNNYE